jgi:hypothetical protein
LYTVSNRIIAALRRATRPRKVNINNINKSNKNKKTISAKLSAKLSTKITTITPPSITTTKVSF